MYCCSLRTEDRQALFVNINFKILKSTTAQDGRTHIPVCSAWSPHSCSWSQDHHTGCHHTPTDKRSSHRLSSHLLIKEVVNQLKENLQNIHQEYHRQNIQEQFTAFSLALESANQSIVNRYGGREV